MSTALERRTAKLERAAHSDGDRIDVIVVRGMSIVGNKTVRASFGDQAVDRRADETEDDFIERATAAALAATRQPPCLLFLLPEEVLQ